MSGYSIIYTPEAEAQLLALITTWPSKRRPATAARFTDAIVERCEALCDFAERGAPRFSVRPGLRTLPFRRVTITYAVQDRQVVIVGIFFGGQDHESILRQD